VGSVVDLGRAGKVAQGRAVFVDRLRQFALVVQGKAAVEIGPHIADFGVDGPAVPSRDEPQVSCRTDAPSRHHHLSVKLFHFNKVLTSPLLDRTLDCAFSHCSAGTRPRSGISLYRLVFSVEYRGGNSSPNCRRVRCRITLQPWPGTSMHPQPERHQTATACWGR